MNLSENSDYIKVSKFLLKPIFIFFVMICVIVTLEVASLYFVFVPKVINSFQGEFSFEQSFALKNAMNQIIMNMSVWLIVLLVINAFLIKIVHNAKNLVKGIDKLLTK